jgi:flagellar basal body rod protein FlgC
VTDFGLLDVAARGMNAQRALLDIDARNVAAAQAAVPGHPYQRLVAHFTTGLDDDADASAGALTVTSEAGTGDALTELIATLDAQRAYEADASIFDIGKRLAERTLDIER